MTPMSAQSPLPLRPNYYIGPAPHTSRLRRIRRSVNWFTPLTGVFLWSFFIMVIYCTRILTLYFPPLATGIVVLGLGCMALFLPFIKHLRYAEAVFAVTAVLVLVMIWGAAYVSHTALPFTFKKLSSYMGITLVFPLIWCFQRYGTEWTLRAVCYVSAIYIAWYDLQALHLPVGNTTPVILHDFGRGYRLYLASCIAAFVFCYQLDQLFQKRIGPLGLAILGATALAFVLSQSRFAQLSLVLCVVLWWMPPRVKQIATIILLALLAAFFVFSISFSSEVAAYLSGDPTLTLRIRTLADSVYLFSKYPILGQGIPGNIMDYSALMGYAYNPSDFGLVGVAAAYGIVGLCLFYYLMVALMRGAALMDHMSSLGMQGLGATCRYALLYSAISPTILEADGSIIVAMALAVLIFTTRRGSLPRSANCKMNGTSSLPQTQTS